MLSFPEITFRFCPDEIDECKRFADEKAATGSYDVYRKRGSGKNLGQLKLDTIVGKLGEIAVWRFFCDTGYCPDYPDFTVYSARQKSFAPDLVVDGTPVHVKTCLASSAERYGESWVFQYCGSNDAVGGTDDLFAKRPHTDHDHIVFVRVEDDLTQAVVRAYCNALFLHQNNLFELPKLRTLQATKVVVYYASLERMRARCA